MRIVRKIALATIAAGILVVGLSGGTAVAGTSNTVHPLCSPLACWV